MARKRSSVKVICSCGKIVSGNGKCTCGRSYQVGVKEAPKKRSNRKQDGLYIPEKTEAFLMRFVMVIGLLTVAIIILANWGG